MIEIRPLTHFDAGDLRRIGSGYTAAACYTVSKSETPARIVFALELVPLDQPRVRRFTYEPDQLERYPPVVAGGFSLGAFDGATMVGIAIAERHDWNNTLWVWEFHVAETHRGQGVGSALMQALVERAQQAGIRALICETQTANEPAIRF